MEFVLGLVLLGAIALIVVLPIIAIIRTGRIQELEGRIARLEAALLLTREQAPRDAASNAPALIVPERSSATGAPTGPPAPALAIPPRGAAPEAGPTAAAKAAARSTVPVFSMATAESRAHESLETTIGRKWVGWVAIVLIFGATLFFLKYAFDNRWIGELGRVTLGIAAGIAMVAGGYERHRKQWRYLSQVLTSGGVIVLYLSIYAAFGYYHLISQTAAFLFLAVIVAEAYFLALVYEARVVVFLGIAGGFLVPVLLSSDRDQYLGLFTYMAILNCGTLGVLLARNWPGTGSLSYAATQLLFWSWYAEHYHPEKRGAALWFQFLVLSLFVTAGLVNRWRGRATGPEEWIRTVVAPFTFYATCYYLLNEDHHDWMAALALLLAVVFAGIAKWNLTLAVRDQPAVMVALATALTFVTLAIPVQLRANWITLAWGVEGLALLWAAQETAPRALRWFSGGVFALSLYRFLLMDTPWQRTAFTPVFNRYFLGVLGLAGCLAMAAYLSGRRIPPNGYTRGAAWISGFAAFGVLLLGSSVEAYGYFSALAAAVRVNDAQWPEEARQLRWAAQLALSLLWAGYALALSASGFHFRQRRLRAAGLILFGLTLAKAVFFDIAGLEAFYRIVALGALGLVLLGVAWAYQRVLRQEQGR